jgi:hypothetical protein
MNGGFSEDVLTKRPQNAPLCIQVPFGPLWEKSGTACIIGLLRVQIILPLTAQLNKFAANRLSLNIIQSEHSRQAQEDMHH